jgi:hypothetical protein
MLRKKSPRLAAAFVVTISAGCGGSGSTPIQTKPPTEATGPEDPNWVPNIGSVQGGFYRDGEGKCFIQHPANPPWSEPVDCETQKPLPAEPDKPPADSKPVDTPTSDTKPTDPKPPEAEPQVDLASLPPAPAGWRLSKLPNGACMAYPSSHCSDGKRCNPPPPRTVQCPKNMPKEAADPLAL